jgi:pSer/pThr/pTyr-binding forkhead associated (FHA) protein
MPAAPLPPANPYATVAQAAIVSSPMGEYSVRIGAEVRVGRDPGQCAITFAEPRISGIHATLKFDGERLWVRDEASNNGVFVSSARIPAAVWTPVPIGAPLRVGPIEMSVRLA